MSTCKHGKKINEECDECRGGFDHASPIIVAERDDWFCMKCGKMLVEIKLDSGTFASCLFCKIAYTIHGTGVDDSLFIAGAERLKIEF